ncbi:MAG: histidine phosphatase family protein [Candidatus Flexifilum sp.]|jgi:broad specificity phosphatase PhoE
MMHAEQTWYIFRHGLATRSRTGYGDQILTATLLPEGIPPIERLAEHMKAYPCDIGLRSELIRCQQTADIVSRATGYPFAPDPRLNETIDETFDSLRERVRAFIADYAASPHRHLWICTHGAVIAALKHLLTRGEFTPPSQNDYTQPGELLIVRGPGHTPRTEVLSFRYG